MIHTWDSLDFDNILVFHSCSTALPRCTRLEPGHHPLHQLGTPASWRLKLCPWRATVLMERNRKESWPMLRFRNLRGKLMNAWSIPRSLRKRVLNPTVLRVTILMWKWRFLSQRFLEGGLLQRAAAQALLASLATPAPSQAPKAKPGRKGKDPKAKAKAKVKKNPKSRAAKTKKAGFYFAFMTSCPWMSAWCSFISQNQFCFHVPQW